MINIADYTDSKYNIAPDELKHFHLFSLRIVMAIMMFPVEESEHIMNHVPHSTFERVNKNEHDFDRRPNDEAITIYRKVVDFLNAITMV